MAAGNKRISELAVASPLELSDQIVVERGAAPPNYRATMQQILSLGPSAHTIDSHDTVATGAQLNILTSGGNADALHVHAGVGAHTIDSHDTVATGAQLDTLTGGGNADALHAHAVAAHTIVSHSDTVATGAQLDTLTGGGNADALHAHAVGGIGGSGTVNKIPLWTGTETLGNSVITQSGSDIDIAGILSVTGGFALTSGNVSIVNGNLEVFAGVIAAGSLEVVITTAAGLLRHQAIDPSIAGSGLSVAAGVLSVDANGGVGGSGTVNKIPLWTGTETLGDSAITQSGSAISMAGTLSTTGAISVLDGNLTVGVNDNTLGVIQVFGNNTSVGGILKMFNPADLDATYQHFVFQANGSHLRLGANGSESDFLFGGNGDFTVGAGGLNVLAGSAILGSNSSNRGTLVLWDGSGGNQASYVKLYSRNGSARFLFIEDDGTVKVHTKTPVNNTDGVVVGEQVN